MRSIFQRDPIVQISIDLKNEENRACHPVLFIDNTSVFYPIYNCEEKVVGTITFKVRHGNLLKHCGILLDLIGKYYVVTSTTESDTFLIKQKQLVPSGTLIGTNTFKFSFSHAVQNIESYYGMNIRIRYYLSVSIKQEYKDDILQERDLWFVHQDKTPFQSKEINTIVNLDNRLQFHIICKTHTFYLNDIINGYIQFNSIQMNIQNMTINIIRKEYVDYKNQHIYQEEIVGSHEIIVGTPEVNTIVPFRLFLSPLDLTPTFDHVLNILCVTYCLRLVVCDSSKVSFYKEIPINLWRKMEWFDDYTSDSDCSESDISVDESANPIINEMVESLRHRKPTTVINPKDEVIDSENCNYLNEIAIFMLVGLVILLSLLFTSRRS